MTLVLSNSPLEVEEPQHGFTLTALPEASTGSSLLTTRGSTSSSSQTRSSRVNSEVQTGGEDRELSTFDFHFASKASLFFISYFQSHNKHMKIMDTITLHIHRIYFHIVCLFTTRLYTWSTETSNSRIHPGRFLWSFINKTGTISP